MTKPQTKQTGVAGLRSLASTLQQYHDVNNENEDGLQSCQSGGKWRLRAQ